MKKRKHKNTGKGVEIVRQTFIYAKCMIMQES